MFTGHCWRVTRFDLEGIDIHGAADAVYLLVGEELLHLTDVAEEVDHVVLINSPQVTVTTIFHVSFQTLESLASIFIPLFIIQLSFIYLFIFHLSIFLVFNYFWLIDWLICIIYQIIIFYNLLNY